MKPGEIVIFETGEYSDYGIAGVFIANETFSLDEQLAVFLKKPVDEDAYKRFDAQKFMKWLVELDYLHEHKVLRAHLGSYGSIPDNLPLEKPV